MAWLVGFSVQVNKHFSTLFPNIALCLSKIKIFFYVRSIIMLWFLWELRNTMKYEHSTRKLDFLLHFGASSLVWFIYLPIVAIVASQVSPLWRYKLLLGEFGILIFYYLNIGIYHYMICNVGIFFRVFVKQNFVITEISTIILSINLNDIEAVNSEFEK